MKKDFKTFLINAGFAVKTINGKASTVYDYLRGVKRVCMEENLSIEGVANNIDELVIKYQTSNVGREISRSVRCGMVQFAKFVNNQKVS